MFLTSLLLLVASLVVLVLGALRGSTGMIGTALVLAVGGAACMGAALLLARRSLVRDGLVTGGGGLGSAKKATTAGGASLLDSPPVVGYDGMDEVQVKGLMASGALGRDQLAVVLAYEAAHQGRPAVLEAAQAALREQQAAPAGG